MTFDDVIENKVGAIGLWQVSVGFMIVMSLGDSMQMIPQLANIAPPFVCSAPWFKGWTYHDIVNISSRIADLQQQRFDGVNQTSTPDLKCHRYDLSSITNVLNNRSTEIEKKKTAILTFANDSRVSREKCPDSWLYDSASSFYRHSLIEAFDLVCQRQKLIPFSAIVYTIGAGIGVLSGGQLADRYGRKFMLSIAYPLIGLFGILVIFPEQFLFFLLLRLCIGITAMMFYVTSLVYVFEHTNHKHRNTFSVIDGLFKIAFVRNFGVLLNYLIQDYRFVHLTYGILILCGSIVFIVFYHESPRWLVAKGRHTEALVILRKAIIMNGGSENDANALTIEDICLSLDQEAETQPHKGVCQQLLLVFRDWINLFSHPESIKRWVPLSVMWMTVGCVYFGVSYYGVRIKGINPYIIAFVMSSFAFPAKLLQWCLFEKFDRKKPLIGLYFVAFVFCVTGLLAKITEAPKEIIVVCATLIISCATCLFGSLYLVTPELFPTLFRVKAAGFLSALCRLGIISGLFIERLEGFWPLLCFSLALALGFIFTLFLPRGDYKTMIETFPTKGIKPKEHNMNEEAKTVGEEEQQKELNL